MSEQPAQRSHASTGSDNNDNMKSLLDIGLRVVAAGSIYLLAFAERLAQALGVHVGILRLIALIVFAMFVFLGMPRTPRDPVE